ncbi:hypothetical protein [Thiosulfativibrio zosterae]|uniref:HPt domain-containing protein n=1 Tax=Thiosulfativibrio zosterae TaxID=2675053 RepID=A0A6F8PJP4_9GAMM|nr:hypothetical protein [Thiosulfativibrio zosterae]BBP42323.1 hypothetical protein THMIRHAT_00690 [Thiosulfativibrio zosterae]
MNLTDQTRVSELVNLVGLSEVKKIRQQFSIKLNMMVKNPTKGETISQRLHTLKGMCYALGINSKGKHIETIERMITNGASTTAQTHIHNLYPVLQQELIDAEQFLNSLENTDSLS